MSNPPEGWYPDPTGQPNTIRWWNGKQWTNRTQHEDAAEEPSTEPDTIANPQASAETGPGATAQSFTETQEFTGPRPVWEVQQDAQPTEVAGSSGSEDAGDESGWWQQSASPQLWANAEPQESGESTQASAGPRLSAVVPDDDADEPTDVDGLSPFERARATWDAPVIAPAPPEHWSQRDVSDEALDDPIDTPEEPPANGWTLKLAPAPADPDVHDSSPNGTPPANTNPTAGGAATGSGQSQSWSDVSWTDAPTVAPQPAPDADDPTQIQPAWGTQPDHDQTQVQPAWGESGEEQPAWGAQSDPDQAQNQPAWGAQSEDQGQPAWGMQQADQANGWGAQGAEGSGGPEADGQQAPTWGAQQTRDDASQGQQPWGGQTWTLQQDGGDGPAPAWGPQQTGTDPWQSAAGEQQPGAQESVPWGQQTTSDNQSTAPWGQQAGEGQGGEQQSGAQNWAGGQQAAPQAWGEQGSSEQGAGQQQAWGEQSAGQQGAPQAWGEQGSGQQAAPQAWGEQGAGQQQGWGGGQQGVQQAWGEVGGQQAWGEQGDGSGGDGRGGKREKKGKGDGGGPSGAKLPLMVGGAVALVMLVVAAIFLIANPGGDKKADPQNTGTLATQPTGSQPTDQPTGQSSTKPGQSKNPKLHEGNRISSDAISFPRRNPPWSDRKRLVPQLLNSSGQYVVLQEKFDGKNDWYADIFVGALGTGSGFNGDPKATAAALSIQLRTSMYGDIPVTFKTIANGAVKRSDKSGWFFQQTVTANSAKVTARVLTLTVAVFDLGDGTAVAYVSDIPTTRLDLRTAESQAYKGINVG